MANAPPKRFDGENYKASDIQRFLYHEGFDWTNAPGATGVKIYTHKQHTAIRLELPEYIKANSGTKYVKGAEWEKAWLNAAHRVTMLSAVTAATAQSFAGRTAKKTNLTMKQKFMQFDIVIDNTLLTNLMKVRQEIGALAPVDIIKHMAQLPNIRLIVPEKVFDECFSGTPNLAAKRLFEQASHLETNEHGETTEILGENPKIFIWHSLKGAQLIAHKAKGDHGGEQNIMDYCASPACTRPVIIVSDDNTYFVPTLHIGEQYETNVCTNDGYSIGYITTPGFLRAVKNTMMP